MFRLDDFHEYQRRVTVDAIEQRQHAIFLKMGLGKTIVALTIVYYFLQQKMVKRALVIAPLKVVQNVWRQEAELWEHTKDLRFAVMHGTPQDRLYALHQDADVYLINYENMPWLADTIRKYGYQNYFQVVFFDESTKIKHAGTTRFRKWRNLIGAIPYRYVLTGTPAPNGLLDLWGQYFMLDQGARLFSSKGMYQMRYFQKVADYKWVILAGAKEIIESRVRDITTVLDSRDYLDMPDRIETDLKIDLPLNLRTPYTQLEREFFLEWEGAQFEIAHAATLSLKLRQFVQGQMYISPGSRDTKRIHKEKLDYLKDIMKNGKGAVEGISGNAIIAYNFHFEREDLRSLFPNAPFVDGTSKAADEEKAFKDWNAGKVPVLLCNAASLAFGLNLQFGGSTLIWYSLTWNLEHYDQLIARLERQGQVQPVYIIHLLMRNTVDEMVARALRVKDRTQTSFCNALKRFHIERN